MIVCINGVKGGSDLSNFVDREGAFEVSAALGNRMDTLHMTLWDPDLELAIPDRAEIIIYDAPPGTQVVDPPNNPGWVHNGKNYITSQDPTKWTPRLFAGYTATAEYTMSGAMRQIVATAQDYTYRNKTTMINKSFVKGLADSDIIKQLYQAYRPDIDTTNVLPVIHALAEGAMTYGGPQVLGSGLYGYLLGGGASYGDQTGGNAHYGTDVYADPAYKNPGMPSFRFGTHTLEQMMGRITKISHGQYRVDYYKRLFYSAPGQQKAPFNLGDTPGPVSQGSGPGTPTSFGNTGYGVSPYGAMTPVGPQVVSVERMRYNPDASGLINRVWVVGARFTSNPTQYSIQPLPNGLQAQFLLPATPTDLRNSKVLVNGVSQGVVGVVGVDGTIEAPQDWPAGVRVMMSGSPAMLVFHPLFIPPLNAAITIVVKFTYPVIQVVTDPVKVAAAGGNIFEGLLRDKRIDDATLAIKAGQAYLSYQGSSHKGGDLVLRTPGLAPGMTVDINHKIFTGLWPNNTLHAVINHVTTTLDGDQVQPYEIKIDFADQPELDAAQGDVVDMAISEAARVNAALDQTTPDDQVQDIQQISDTMDFQPETVTPTGRNYSDYLWAASDSNWGFAEYGQPNRRAVSFLATLTPSGSLRLGNISTQGSVSFSGQLTKVATGPGQLAASLSFSGTLSRVVFHKMTAGLTPAAQVAKFTGRVLTASLSPSGAMRKKDSRGSTAGALTMSGVLATSLIPATSNSAQPGKAQPGKAQPGTP